MKIQSKLAVVFCALLMVACKQQGSTVSEQENLNVAEDSIMDDDSQILQMTVYKDKKHHIYFEGKDTRIYCYADSQRVVFNDDRLDNGAIGLYYHRPDNNRYIYIIGATYIRYGGGWQDGLHLYQMDIHTLALKHIGNYAAIHFEDNGFKVANVERLLNPDTKFRGEERYAIRDYFFDKNGKFVKRGRNEYGNLYKEYGDTMVNAVGISYLD